MVVSVLFGIVSGVAKLGWLPFFKTTYHGFVFLNGFVGGLICMEKYLGSDHNKRAYLVLCFSCTTAALGSLSGYRAFLLVSTAVPAILVLLSTYTLMKEKVSYHGLIQLLALSGWFIGNLKFYQQFFYPISISGWQVFVLGMIISTRLRRSGAWGAFPLVMTVMSAAFSGLLVNYHETGRFLIGGSYIILAVLMGIIEYRKQPGFNITSAYVWLSVTGVAMLFESSTVFNFDIIVHAFFLGFLFQMIQANVPDIITEKFQREVSLEKPALIWGVVLNVALVVRLFLGDWAEDPALRRVGGLLTGLALFGFMAHLLFSILSTTKNHLT